MSIFVVVSCEAECVASGIQEYDLLLDKWQLRLGVCLRHVSFMHIKGSVFQMLRQVNNPGAHRCVGDVENLHNALNGAVLSLELWDDSHGAFVQRNRDIPCR